MLHSAFLASSLYEEEAFSLEERPGLEEEIVSFKRPVIRFVKADEFAGACALQIQT